MPSNITSDAFIERNIIANSNWQIAWFTFIVAAGVALITVSAKIQVPFWPVPMTLQTLAIMLIFAAGGRNVSVATILTYLAAGLAGLPVFAGPVAGPAYFAGPTAGFLAGFVLAAFIVGYAADKGWGKSPFKLFAAMALADIVIFAIGFFWLAFIFVSARSGTTLGMATAFKVGVQPYILADLVKVTLASALVPALWGLTRRLRGQ